MDSIRRILVLLSLGFLFIVNSSILAQSEKLISAQLDISKVERIVIRSEAFKHGTSIPKLFTGEGENISPQLSWEKAPPSTKSWILICEDPDAPSEKPFIHWVVSSIPAEVTGLPEAVPASLNPRLDFKMYQSVNSRSIAGYLGPMPPQGHGVHHYYFELFALSDSIRLRPVIDREEIVNAMKGKIIGYGELMGTYERRRP